MDRFNKIIDPLSLDHIGAGADAVVRGVGNIGSKIGGVMNGLRNSLSGGVKPIQNIPVGGRMMKNISNTKQVLDSLAKGGSIKKTGMYKIHKGESVLSREKALENKKK